MNLLIVEIEGLTKVYESKQRVVAVDGVDLELKQGEIFGLLGPNGAGKTTTISIATTRTLPTSGKVRIAGIDVVEHPAHARRHIGVVPQFNTLDRSLTVYENLYFHCRYFGFSHSQSKARSLELLAQFLLSERKDAYPQALSGGLAQRVQIARAIAHRPTVLFLDEPSAGLDPQSRLAMWTAVEGLRKEGITVLLTTHYMEEADKLCDRIAIVDHGKLVALGTPVELKNSVEGTNVVEVQFSREDDIWQQRLEKLDGVTHVQGESAGFYRVLTSSGSRTTLQLVQLAAEMGETLRSLSVQNTTLDDVFVHYTGRQLRDEQVKAVNFLLPPRPGAQP